MQVISFIQTAALGAFVLLVCAGCKTANQGEGRESVADAIGAPTKIPIGALHVVRPDEGFVLIRSTRFLQIEAGTDLITYGNGGAETSRLRVSPARKGQFVTADILSGAPKVGDQALMDYVAKAPEIPGGQASNDIQVLE